MSALQHDDFLCSLRRPGEPLVPGRLYVSGEGLAFKSKRTGEVLAVPLAQIRAVEKRTDNLLPVAIQVVVEPQGPLLFTSFLLRNSAYDLLDRFWTAHKQQKVREATETAIGGEGPPGTPTGASDGDAPPGHSATILSEYSPSGSVRSLASSIGSLGPRRRASEAAAANAELPPPLDTAAAGKFPLQLEPGEVVRFCTRALLQQGRLTVLANAIDYAGQAPDVVSRRVSFREILSVGASVPGLEIGNCVAVRSKRQTLVFTSIPDVYKSAFQMLHTRWSLARSSQSAVARRSLSEAMKTIPVLHDRYCAHECVLGTFACALHPAIYYDGLLFATLDRLVFHSGAWVAPDDNLTEVVPMDSVCGIQVSAEPPVSILVTTTTGQGLLYQPGSAFQPAQHRHLDLIWRHHIADSNAWQCMQGVAAVMAQPFDADNAQHQRMLDVLWKAADFPESADRDFRRLGFQSKNPMSDLRGTGVFGLVNLVFLAEHYPDCWRRLAAAHALAFESSNHDRYYPLAAAAISLSFSLFDLVDLHAPDRVMVRPPDCPAFVLWSLMATSFTGAFATEAATDDDPEFTRVVGHCWTAPYDTPWVMHELLAAALVALDKLFHLTESGYMDFAKVLERLIKGLKVALASRPGTRDDLWLRVCDMQMYF